MKSLTDEQTRGGVYKVNLLLLGVVFYGFVFYFTWPTSKEWWGFGITSILMGLACVATFIRAMRLIWQIYRRDKTFSHYQRKGGEQKSSRMASDEALQKAGMRDV